VIKWVVGDTGVCVYMRACVRVGKLFMKHTDTPMLVFSGSTEGGGVWGGRVIRWDVGGAGVRACARVCVCTCVRVCM